MLKMAVRYIAPYYRSPARWGSSGIALFLQVETRIFGNLTSLDLLTSIGAMAP